MPSRSTDYRFNHYLTKVGNTKLPVHGSAIVLAASGQLLRMSSSLHSPRKLVPGIGSFADKRLKGGGSPTATQRYSLGVKSTALP